VPHCNTKRIDPVDDLTHVTVREAHVDVRSAGIAVAAGLAERRPGEEVSRRREQACFDRLREADITTRDVAHAREPAPKRLLEPARAIDCRVAQRPSL